VPILVGVGGNATGKVVKTLTRFERFEFDGTVSVCPYCNRPTQDGMKQRFVAISAATDRQVLIYNIPYRTSVNLTNGSLLELAQIPNIVGAKDISGSISQSLDLLARKHDGFSVLTGEDQMFFTMIRNGAEGGILASSHIATSHLLEIVKLIAGNDCHAARAVWTRLQKIVPLLFQEANPMPIKYCLWKHRLIASPECRLPLTSISEGLAGQLDGLLVELRD
jgi:4-hydroxy-tetrahydrodipicolinate synthase